MLALLNQNSLYLSVYQISFMSLSDFQKAILRGIPSELPEPQMYDPGVNHAPVRKDILSNLEKHRPGLSMKELIDAVADAVGDWPPDSLVLAMFSVKGHLDRLEGQGKIRAVRGARPGKWELA